VNQVMDAFADGSFQSFDAMEATPLDVLQCLKTFLLIVPEPPIPCSLFYELLDSCYEVSKEKQVQDVRNLLMRVSSACRAIARTVIDLCRKVLACQPSLQLTEIAQFVASALARPEVDQVYYYYFFFLLLFGKTHVSFRMVARQQTASHSRMRLRWRCWSWENLRLMPKPQRQKNPLRYWLLPARNWKLPRKKREWPTKRWRA
jgi:hypothetical protein